MKRVLFVCTGNSCRSVMAEGIFRKITESRAGEFKIGSAGISALDGFPPTEETVQVMREHGIDVSGHRTRRLMPSMIEDNDPIYVMERYHRDWILSLFPNADDRVQLLSDYSVETGGSFHEVDIPDPIRMSPLFYENVYGMIERCVQNIAEEL